MKKVVSEHSMPESGESYGNGIVNIAIGGLCDAESDDNQQSDDGVKVVDVAQSVP